jgi:hypothetical protein
MIYVISDVAIFKLAHVNAHINKLNNLFLSNNLCDK